MMGLVRAGGALQPMHECVYTSWCELWTPCGKKFGAHRSPQSLSLQSPQGTPSPKGRIYQAIWESTPHLRRGFLENLSFSMFFKVFQGFSRLPNIAIFHRCLPLWDSPGSSRLPKVGPRSGQGFLRCCTFGTFVFEGSPASFHGGGCGFILHR